MYKPTSPNGLVNNIIQKFIFKHTTMNFMCHPLSIYLYKILSHICWYMLEHNLRFSCRKVSQVMLTWSAVLLIQTNWLFVHCFLSAQESTTINFLRCHNKDITTMDLWKKDHKHESTASEFWPSPSLLSRYSYLSGTCSIHDLKLSAYTL